MSNFHVLQSLVQGLCPVHHSFPRGKISQGKEALTCSLFLGASLVYYANWHIIGILLHPVVLFTVFEAI